MLTRIQALAAADLTAGLPEWIVGTAAVLWAGREEEFLRTCCHATTARVRRLLAEERGNASAFIVSFGDDHELAVVGDRVYQSYAFKSDVQESAYDSTRPLWQHILAPYHEDGYAHIKPSIDLL